jgi:uncharacterized membrane protein
MLSETVVSALLEASVTGAGLVLAVYALVTPISGKIFRERARRLKRLLGEFEEEKNKITPDRDLKRLKELQKQTKQLRVFPSYWGIGMLLTFILFMVSLLFSYVWLTNTDTIARANFELSIVVTFELAWIALLVIGISTIVEIYLTMRKEFEEIKETKRKL